MWTELRLFSIADNALTVLPPQVTRKYEKRRLGFEVASGRLDIEIGWKIRAVVILGADQDDTRLRTRVARW